MLYRRSEKYHNKTLGAEALRRACKDYNPQITLGILKTHTKCSPISEVQMETYLNGILKSEQLDAKIDFNSVSSYDKLKYNFLKQCWLKIAFNAFKGNRAQMQNFLNIILYQALQGAEQSLICASFTESNNHGAMLQHLIDTQYLILNITANIENFLADIEKYVFPKFITTRIRSALLSTTIEPGNMNATAQKIGDEIMTIDDSKNNLKDLMLANNPITSIPKAINFLPNLWSLDLVNSSITSIKYNKTIKNKSVSVFYISLSNHLVEVGDCAFCNFPNSFMIHLSASPKLSKIHENAFGTTRDLPELLEVKLESCNISTLPKKLLNRRIHIYINDNPIVNSVNFSTFPLIHV